MVWGTIAVAAVSIAAQALLPKPKKDKPDLEPPDVPTSSLGVALPSVYGEIRVGGKFFYTTRPFIVEGKGIGGKGAPPKEEENDSFEVKLMAYALSFGSEVELRELYLNGELVYARDSFSGQQDEFDDWADTHLDFFSGSAIQDPSPRLEELEGAGNIPHWRGMSYIVIRNLNLGAYGNGYPAVHAVLRSLPEISNTKIFLDRVLTDSNLNLDSQSSFEIDVLTINPRLENIPFSGLGFSNDGKGYYSAINDYLNLYQIYLKELGSGTFELDLAYDLEDLEFAEVTTIAVPQVLGTTDSPAYKITDLTKERLSTSLSLSFIDPIREYDTNSITVYKNTSSTQNSDTVSTKYALKRSQAFGSAERLIRAAWSIKKKIQFTLPINDDDRLRLGQKIRFNGDVVLNATNWFITEKTYGKKFVVEITAVELNPIINAYGKNVVEVSAENVNTDPSDAEIAQFSIDGHIFDVNLATSADTPKQGAYFAYSIPDLNVSCQIYRSEDLETYDFIETVSQQSTFGRLIEELPAADFFVEDWRNELTVRLTDSDRTLSSITEAEFQRGDTIYCVNRELILAKTATAIGEQGYRLTRLIRGYRGTEAFIQDHPEGSPFIRLTEAGTTQTPRIEIPERLNNSTLGFKLVTDTRTNIEDLDAVEIEFQGRALRSYCPQEQQPMLGSNGDWFISWIDRSIASNGDYLTDGTALPDTQTGLVFEVRIYDNSTAAIARTVTVSGSTGYLYSTAEQTEDTGSAIGSISFDAFKLTTASNIGASPSSQSISN